MINETRTLALNIKHDSGQCRISIGVEGEFFFDTPEKNFAFESKSELLKFLQHLHCLTYKAISLVSASAETIAKDASLDASV